MGGDKTLRGPDLAAGIEETALEDGAKLLGHAGGEPVLLVRAGAEVFAIGAKCTHYGGPLAEGIVVGDTVRCPWHHACFSLRTGEVLRPPALADEPRFIVERQGGRLRVTGKDPAKRAPRTPKRSPESVLIVGAGAAGNAAAETLRREGYAGPVTIVDTDPDSPYDRPNLSKDYLAGRAPEAWIPLHPKSFYEKRKIEIVRAEAVALDAEAKRVTLADGSARAAEAVLLAPGAEPIRVELSASPDAKVYLLRSLADSRAIIEAAEGARRAAVLGAGFIGLEAAASLRQRGLEVHVVAPDDRPLGKVLGPDLGDFIRAVHEKQGVVFHLGRTAKAIAPGRLSLDDGTAVDADFLVMGVGVRPRVGLAQQAGLKVGNGIEVDEYLETSRTGVWAAGDAASWPDPHTGQRIRVEHWVLAERMGQAAARNILGAEERFDAVPFFWSQHYDDVINYVGHGAGWDEAVLDGKPLDRDCAVTFRRAGRTLAVATIFRDRQSLEIEAEMERNVTSETA
ncbi:MAG TPA: FAD-dependent oxidoreductase [Gammaproteobacteria bacterium]|nr:FAD-dependent oxidoreductase [Gammaproteobacteria bacterium]